MPDSRICWTGGKLLFQQHHKPLSTFVQNRLLSPTTLAYYGQYSIVRLLCEMVTPLAKNCCWEWKVGRMEGIGRGNNSLNQWSQEPDISGTHTRLLRQALTSLLLPASVCFCVCASQEWREVMCDKNMPGLHINNPVLIYPFFLFFCFFVVIPCPWGCNDLRLIHT